MRYCFQNDLYYLLEDLDGNYDLTEEQVAALAHQKLSLSRIEPVADLGRALRIERGEEEPNFDDIGDWQYYRNQEYVDAFTGRYPFIGGMDELLSRLQERERPSVTPTS